MGKEKEEDLLFLSWVADASASINCIWTSPRPEYITRLAREYRKLKEQRADNPGVFDDAPPWASEASVAWMKGSQITGRLYTRTFPKTKAREIAEKAVNDGNGFHAMINGVRAVDVIEQAILEYEKQTKGE